MPGGGGKRQSVEKIAAQDIFSIITGVSLLIALVFIISISVALANRGWLVHALTAAPIRTRKIKRKFAGAPEPELRLD
jgi:hypothetical protein